MAHATILYVEDNRLVLHMVKETLDLEGWRVETCEDGLTALGRIESATPFDLILLDNDLPGVSGVELAQQARGMWHRRRTPILMLSASDCRREAGRAGVNCFLKKPEDIYGVVAAIKRLMAASLGE
jgi:DNA-binding response OmpR family regulator